jgi:ABC-2 type transport system permease protein
MKISIDRPVAFIKKDILIEFSYKLQFILSWLGIFLSLLVFYYISKLFPSGKSPYLAEYGGEYFPFVFIGIMFSGYLALALGSFSANIRNEQLTGTLEAMFLTPVKPSVIISSISLWKFIFNSIGIIVYLLFGVCVFGINLGKANLMGALLILLLTIISLSGIGVISASFTIVFKRGDPVCWILNLLSAFFSGVYFPLGLLPDNLRRISDFIPVTYSLRGLRNALLRGEGFTALLPDIIAMSIFCIILFPLGLLVFNYAVKRSKAAGSLSHY